MTSSRTPTVKVIGSPRGVWRWAAYYRGERFAISTKTFTAKHLAKRAAQAAIDRMSKARFVEDDE